MDDKGRIKIFFWRINIIDFLVILFVLCCLPGFYFGWKIMVKEGSPEQIVVVDKAEYEQKQIHQKEMLNLIEQLRSLNAQKESFLKEHKRARKYFR